MKILFFSHYFPPEVNAPATRLHENGKRWVRGGHHLAVVTSAPNCPDGILFPGYRNRLYQREEIDGIDVRRVWTYLAPNRGKVRRSLNYASYLFSATVAGLLGERPDVIVATTPQFLCAWAGVLVGAARRIPTVVEVRDLWPESIGAVGAMRRGLVFRVLEWMERRLYAAAKHIVTVGDGYRDQLVARGVPTGKVTVVTNGVDRELLSPRSPDPELVRKHDLEGRFVCGYVGTVGMASGLEIVLAAATKLRDAGRDDFVFLVVGDGAVREELATRARSLGLGNVVFTGRQDKATAVRYLSCLDACLIHLKKSTTFHTVLPSKLFEAAGMAKPIILGVEGAAAAFVTAAGAGIPIEPGNADDLVAALSRLAADPDHARALGEAGLAYVLAHHDRDVLAERYLDLLEGLI